MPRLTYTVTLQFPAGEQCGFIAEPYWPEMYHYINITKESGMNRARSSANRRKALEEYLKQNGMSLADFEELERKARRPFVTDADGEIIIPKRNVAAFLVATCDELRAASRPCNPDQVRARLTITSWSTGKRGGDGVYSRFATVTSGSGASLSNQRSLRESQYIQNFVARGEISFDDDYVKPAVLKNAIAWGGEFVGIGAARKMGFGRFALQDFSLKKAPLKSDRKSAGKAAPRAVDADAAVEASA